MLGKLELEPILNNCGHKTTVYSKHVYSKHEKIEHCLFFSLTLVLCIYSVRLLLFSSGVSTVYLCEAYKCSLYLICSFSFFSLNSAIFFADPLFSIVWFFFYSCAFSYSWCTTYIYWITLYLKDQLQIYRENDSWALGTKDVPELQSKIYPKYSFLF